MTGQKEEMKEKEEKEEEKKEERKFLRADGWTGRPIQEPFFDCLIQNEDLGGKLGGPQIHWFPCRAPVTTRGLGCFLSLMTGASLKCKQVPCDLADVTLVYWDDIYL